MREAMLSVVNATLVDDEVLHASHLVGLLELLHDLRARYDDHPALLETEADFTDDNSERVALYRRAADISTAQGLSTLTIRLSLADVLLELGRPSEAGAELSACEHELGSGDEHDREFWSQLAAKVGRAESGATSTDGGLVE